MGIQGPSIDPISFLLETADELIPAHITGETRSNLRLQIADELENNNPEIVVAINAQAEEISRELDALYDDPEFRAAADQLTLEEFKKRF